MSGWKWRRGFGQYLLRIEAWRTLIGLARPKAVAIVPVSEVSTFADGERIGAPGRPPRPG